MATIICGIYMIRNKLNGKVYIGQSKDILRRWKYYDWAVKTTCDDYSATKRLIITEMRKYGMENFMFSVLDTSDAMRDKKARSVAEYNYIHKYKADDPKYGYNGSCGLDPYLDFDEPYSRKQETKERMKRAKPVFLYDTYDRSCMLYLGGAKAVGDEFGYGKDVMSHTVKRGSLFRERYYLIPANNSQRKELIEKLRKKKVEAPTQKPHTRVQSTEAYNAFMKAVEDVERYMKKIGML